jgi:protein SCO1/2
MKTVLLAAALCSLLASCDARNTEAPPDPSDELPVRELVLPDLSPHPATMPFGPALGKPLPAEAMAAPLIDETGRERSLAADHGKARVVSFFFRCCAVVTMCPQLTSTLSDTTSRLSADERARIRGFLVSFDPERDTPERLKSYAEEISANPEVLSLLTGRIEDIKKLTEACGVQFTPGENQDIAHNMRTVVMDREGVVTAVFRGAEFPAGELLAALRKAAGADPD